MSQTIQSIRGMHDVLPTETPAWRRLEAVAAELFEAHGYAELRTPAVEKTELFVRAIGEATDVVEKEMYTFDDRNGDSLSLRPEGTAAVVRAALQHGLLYQAPVRLWYHGSMFRHERPQKGRTRQFHQFGAEVFGAAGAGVEAELILLAERLWARLGLAGLVLELNTLGDADERARYRERLQAFLLDHQDRLPPAVVERSRRNPLRVLDSKDPAVRELLADAPLLREDLGRSSREHFDRVCRVLDRAGVRYEINPWLVRGLDYYAHTVFEWTTTELGAQGTVCAGGRYDGLVEMQGGKPWPAVGWALGEERVLALLEQQGLVGEEPPPHAYLVTAGEDAEEAGLLLADTLRDGVPGLRLVRNAGGGSMKAQFKRADRSGAWLALVLGDDELDSGEVTIKPLRSDLEQQRVAMADAATWLKDWIDSAAARAITGAAPPARDQAQPQ